MDPFWAGFDFSPGERPVRVRPWLVRWLTGEQREILANRTLDRRLGRFRGSGYADSWRP